jgi:tRNA 5-methylaminomethyl-2-thiouridine biosynthesis bifunctional protein
MLARLARRASAATWSAAPCARACAAGFGSMPPGSGGKRITLARFAPRFHTPAPPGRRLSSEAPTYALVIGGGLAGAFTARALARQGIACTVIDRHPEPAAEASGNPAGLFHGALMGHDGPHARLLRAAALAAEAVMRAAQAAGVPACIDGLLRLESRSSLAAMQALLERQALPPSYVQALSASDASRLAGAAVTQAAWFYPGGGWVDPAALVRHLLASPGVTWRGATSMQRIAHRRRLAPVRRGRPADRGSALLVWPMRPTPRPGFAAALAAGSARR